MRELKRFAMPGDWLMNWASACGDGMPEPIGAPFAAPIIRGAREAGSSDALVVGRERGREEGRETGREVGSSEGIDRDDEPLSGSILAALDDGRRECSDEVGEADL